MTKSTVTVIGNLCIDEYRRRPAGITGIKPGGPGTAVIALCQRGAKPITVVNATQLDSPYNCLILDTLRSLADRVILLELALGLFR